MSLLKELAGRLKGRVTVVGIGNRLRADDAVGELVADALHDEHRVRVIHGDEVPERMIGPIVSSRPDTILLVDAVDLGASVGATALLEARDLADYEPSTHRLPVALLMALLREETGADVYLIGVQPETTRVGEPVSSAVRETAGVLAKVVSLAIRQRRRWPGPSSAAGFDPDQEASR